MRIRNWCSVMVLGAIVTAAAPARAGGGSLDKALIRKVVQAHIDEVRHCYNEGLARKPDLAGKLTVDFTISKSGDVSASEVRAGSTVGDAKVEACIAAAVKSWVFPKPEGDAVVVSYPFALEPG